MRWCILPVHTHSQIRLDLTNQTQNPRRQFFDGWHAVKLVFSPRSKQFTIAQLTESQTSTRQDEDKTEARVSPWRDVGNESSRRIRDLGQYTSKIKVALVLERATPRAHTHSIHRLYNRPRSLPIVRPTLLRLAHASIHTPSTRVTLFTLFTLLTLCTLDYTRYGYVKPIDFVNCRKKAADIQKTRTIRPFTVLFPRTLKYFKRIAETKNMLERLLPIRLKRSTRGSSAIRSRFSSGKESFRTQVNEDLRLIYKKQFIQKTYEITKKKKNARKTSTKIEAKFAAFGIRLDAEPMMKRRLRLVRWRHTMHPGIDVNIPGCDVTYPSFEECQSKSKNQVGRLAIETCHHTNQQMFDSEEKTTKTSQSTNQRTNKPTKEQTKCKKTSQEIDVKRKRWRASSILRILGIRVC